MSLHIFTSTAGDGSMKPLSETEQESVRKNRDDFFKKHRIEADDATLVNLIYEGDNYCRYLTVDDSHRGDGITRPPSIIVDALVTTQLGHALFLPLADCIAAVLYDPTQQVLMLSHLGRHNLEQQGGTESVQYLIDKHGTDPKNVRVWLSPAAGKTNYPLYSFDNQSLHEVAVQQLTDGGVLRKNIEVSPVDTTTDQDYYSHSQFLKGRRPTDGRFAVITVMKA